MLSQTGKVINKLPVRGLPLQTSRRHRQENTYDTLVSVDETIAEEVSKCEKAAGKFKLVDLLTVPMQRILKYHMLLQRLVGQTQASHEEYHSIEQAYNCIINVSEVSL